MDITVVIPTIPGREHLLDRAVASCQAQTLDHEIFIGVDYAGAGPAVTRNALIEDVTTEWTAFLDDDDELAPRHLEILHGIATQTMACVVYPWMYTTEGGLPAAHNADPALARPFNEDLLRRVNYIPVTALVRTKCLKAVGGFPEDEDEEDHGLWLRLVEHRCVFRHTTARTWAYHKGHGTNRGD